MKVYPITTFSQIQVRKQSSQISSANNNQYSKINFQNSTSFKSKVDYRQYYKAIDILYDMGINGENLFLNKKIHKYLPSDAEVFEANFLKLKKAYDNLKEINAIHLFVVSLILFF